MSTRIARLMALCLPVLLACILVSAGGWRIHDGRVERVSHAAPVASAAPVDLPSASGLPGDQASFVHQLSPAVPWPVWVGLIVLCFLPAVASVAAWSGSRRGRTATFSTAGGAP